MPAHAGIRCVCELSGAVGDDQRPVGRGPFERGAGDARTLHHDATAVAVGDRAGDVVVQRAAHLLTGACAASARVIAGWRFALYA